MSFRLNFKSQSRKPVLNSILIVAGLILIVIEFCSAYDPESTYDGIPVIRASSVIPDDQFYPNQVSRRSNNEDDMDDYDDDRDERPSGSSNHDSYQNPAFGESQQAVKDGEDIERFFDKHIGPDNEANGVNELDENETPIHETPIERRSEPDDPYEVAASSPLATIFQTLLSAHKRPIVIETNEPGDGESSQSEQPQVVRPYMNSGYTHMSPMATYASPMASPSSMTSYGPGHPGIERPEAGRDDEHGQVQEIYIARRPTLLRQLQTYSPSSNKMSYQPSNGAYWSGNPQSRYYQQQLQQLQQQQLQQHLGQAQQADYQRYPVAASYAHEQEQPEDDGTVVYGLSLGGGAATPDNDESENDTSNSQI